MPVKTRHASIAHLLTGTGVEQSSPIVSLGAQFTRMFIATEAQAATSDVQVQASCDGGVTWFTFLTPNLTGSTLTSFEHSFSMMRFIATSDVAATYQVGWAFRRSIA